MDEVKTIEGPDARRQLGSMRLGDQAYMLDYLVTAVPNGWLFRRTDGSTETFVPKSD